MSNDQHNDAVLAFRESRPHYEEFLNRIRESITTLLRNARIRTDSIQHRIKTVESLSRKMARPGKSYSKLEEVPDLAGLRVIVYHREDVDRVVEVIQKEFDVDDEASADAATKLAPHEFGYLSVHLVIRLTAAWRKRAEWHLMTDLRAEVQIRTVLQHAWASISHALQYKHEDDVPQALRRRLHRLSALLELADQEFDTLGREHGALYSSNDPKIENVRMILRRALGKSSHSYAWIRNHTPLTYSDAAFEKFIASNTEIFES